MREMTVGLAALAPDGFINAASSLWEMGVMAIEVYCGQKAGLEPVAPGAPTVGGRPEIRTPPVGAMPLCPLGIHRD